MARFELTQGSRRVTASFGGIIVRRNVDAGALIGAGKNDSSRELFYLAPIDRLRIQVAVPQHHAAAIRAQQEVDVKLAERPRALALNLHDAIEHGEKVRTERGEGWLLSVEPRPSVMSAASDMWTEDRGSIHDPTFIAGRRHRH